MKTLAAVASRQRRPAGAAHPLNRRSRDDGDQSERHAPSAKGPAEHFTGSVRIDPLFEARDLARASAASVTFEPGARTAWHTHPLGQRLIVTSRPRLDTG